MARLDYFLISETLLDVYEDSTIKYSYKSDHSPVNLKLNISKHKRGPGVWKLNNSLLLDETFQKIVKKEIELVISTYVCTPYNPKFVQENLNDYNFEYMIEIELLWEVLNAQIRGRIIAFASNKKRKTNLEENKLKTEIIRLENELHKNSTNENWINKLKEKKDKLEDIREHKLKGAFIRSRWQYTNMGEKPSSYFLNLENIFFISKHIRELTVDNESIKKPEQILEKMRQFYENLYKEQENTDIENTSLNPIKERLKKIDEEEKMTLDKVISMEELGNIVKSKNNKSPGPDGFTNEFYKILWPNIKNLLLKLLNIYKHKGQINPAQLESIITCIPKGGKLRNNLKNWRPITLLNSIYKFYSGILAERIKTILPKSIHSDQKGFIKGRFIGENTRLTYDIIEACNRKKIEGIIILIDFEKAFDSISWEFIQKTLQMLNFGNKIISLVKSLQINSSSKILQNGDLSGKIKLGRGCRQGDPISPYILVIAAEILAEAIRSNKNIEGITIYKKEHKISLYADDTTLITKANELSIRNCMLALKEFEKISGLRINKEKTKVAKIGGWGDNGTTLCDDLLLDWTQEFTALGISYNVNNMEQITELNIENKIIEIQKLIYL